MNLPSFSFSVCLPRRFQSQRGPRRACCCKPCSPTFLLLVVFCSVCLFISLVLQGYPKLRPSHPTHADHAQCFSGRRTQPTSRRKRRLSFQLTSSTHYKPLKQRKYSKEHSQNKRYLDRPTQRPTCSSSGSSSGRCCYCYCRNCSMGRS